MEGGDGENMDDTSIKPVTSLRSHFEALKTTPKGESQTKDAAKSHKPGDRLEAGPVGSGGRISLDLPRPESPWIVSQAAGSISTPRTPQGPRSRTSSPSKNTYKRPLSMQVGTSPQFIPVVTPAVTVESPKSPPKGYFSNRGISRSPERSPNRNTFNKIQSLVSQHSSRSSTRPGTPRSESGDKAAPDDVGGTRTLSDVIASQIEIVQVPTPIPPTVNRAAKPKVPAKPAPLTAQDLGSLIPEGRKLSIDKRISPFSTPPSSEGSPSPPDEIPNSAATRLQPQASTAVTHKEDGSLFKSQLNAQKISKDASVDPRLMGFAPTRLKAEKRDPRTLGFVPVEAKPEHKADTALPARANTVSARSTMRDGHDAGLVGSKPAQRHVSESVRPSGPPRYHDQGLATRGAPPRDPRQSGFSSSAGLLNEENRPGLPPRRTGTEPPPRPSEESKRSMAGVHNNLPPTSATSRGIAATKPMQMTHAKAASTAQNMFQPPPKRNVILETGHLLSQDRAVAKTAPRPLPVIDGGGQLAPTLVAEDSDEAEAAFDEPVGIMTDYPDASQANRRPPFFRTGLRDLPIRSDARNFDVCGSFLCTTGYTTRVFDLASGDKTLELSHGETVKVLSVAFRPEQELKSEGSRIWIGNSIGELHEIDVASQAVVASSGVHNRREIIRILRHKKDLWTLDDEGKLFVWEAHESGTPSLKYSHQAHRVPKGHTFSLVVGDSLWLALGKEIRIYKPGKDSTFGILDTPLSQPGVGEVTSGCHTNQSGGRAYFGHADGKVTIYSTKDYSCLGNIKVSDYKINSLAFVGGYLWAAYKTGKIYVYDTSSTPWKVKKDWRAHDGPVAGLIVDPSSIWTLKKLQVTSIGHDQSAKLWDGMLEDDWLESAMHERDVDYCTFRETKVAVVTWNVGATNPLEVRGDFVCDAIHPEDPPELLVFGFQEVVDLEDRAVTAKSILGFGKKKESSKTDQHVSRVYREWRDYLAKCISRYMGSTCSYSELHTSSLIGLFQCVFVRSDVRNRIRGLSAADVKCGMKGRYGNKGALITRFILDDSSLCFINCHLAAGQTQTAHRNNDIATILEAESLPTERDPDTRASLYVGGGDGTQVLDHEICIVNGDLNYRIDAIPRDTVINMIKRKEIGRLLERDQIMVSKKRVSGFRLSPFVEAPITFNPTYKYDVGTDNYDSSEKKRAPAWCDRLLYRGPGRIKQIEYRRHEVRVSDHRPVSGIFKLRIKAIDDGAREQAKVKCFDMFGEVKRRLAAEASVEYLVSSLGLGDKEARALIAQG